MVRQPRQALLPNMQATVPRYPRTSSDRADWKETNAVVHHPRQALLSRLQVPVPEYPGTFSARRRPSRVSPYLQRSRGLEGYE